MLAAFPALKTCAAKNIWVSFIIQLPTGHKQNGENEYATFRLIHGAAVGQRSRYRKSSICIPKGCRFESCLRSNKHNKINKMRGSQSVAIFILGEGLFWGLLAQNNFVHEGKSPTAPLPALSRKQNSLREIQRQSRLPARPRRTRRRPRTRPSPSVFTTAEKAAGCRIPGRAPALVSVRSGACGGGGLGLAEED